MGDICRLFSSLPREQQKKVLEVVVPLYINKLVKERKIEQALSVAREAVARGIDGRIEEWYKTVAEMKKLFDDLEEIRERAMAVQAALGEGRYPSRADLDALKNLLSEARHLFKKYENRLPSDVAAKIRDMLRIVEEEVLPRAEFFVETRYFDRVEKANEVIKEVKELFESERNPFKIAEEIERRDLIRRLNLVYNDLMDLYKRSLRYRIGISDKLHKNAETVERLLMFLTSFHYIMKKLGELDHYLRNYGKNGFFLANPEYVGRLKNILTEALRRTIYMSGEVGKFQDEIGAAARSFADAVMEYLKRLKRDLGSRDPRWIYRVFEPVEKEVGVSLGRVYYERAAVAPGTRLGMLPGEIARLAGRIPEEEEVTPTLAEELEAWVRDVYEANVMHFRSSDPMRKALGAIGIIGAGLLDALTTILRPKALIEQLRALAEMISGTAEAIRARGLQGLADAVGALARDLFGTPERALMTLGYIMAGALGSTIAARIPVPRFVRAVLEDIISGDVPGISIAFMESPKFRKIIEASISWRALRGVTGREAVARALKEVLPEIEKAIPEAAAKELSRSLPRLEALISRTVREAESIEDLIRSFREAITRIGVERLLNLSSELGKVAERIEKSWALRELVSKVRRELSVPPEVVEAIKRSLGVGLPEVAVPKIAKPDILVRGARALEDLLKSIAELRISIQRLRSVIEEVVEAIGEERVTPEVRAALKRLEEAEKMLSRLDIEKAEKAVESIKKLISATEGNIKKLRYELAGRLEELGFRDLAEALRSAGTLKELRRAIRSVIARLLSKFDKPHLAALNAAATMIKEVAASDPLLRALLIDIPAFISKRAELAIRKEGIAAPVLAETMRSVVEKLIKLYERVDPSMASKLMEVLRRLRRGVILLDDLEKLRAAISELPPEISLITDIELIARLLEKVKEYVSEMSKAVPIEVRHAIEDLGSAIRELHEVAIRKEGELKRIIEYTVSTVSPIFERGLRLLIEDLKELGFEETASALEKMVFDFLAELKRGKVNKELAAKLVEELRKIERLPGIHRGLKERLGAVYRSLRDALSRSPSKEIRKALENIAVEIKRIIDTVPEIPDKYGFIVIEVKGVKYIPALAPIELKNRIMEIIRRGSVSGAVRIDGLRAAWRRTINMLPDGTMEIIYRIEFPTGNWLEYRYAIKPVGRGRAYIVSSYAYDPNLPKNVEVVRVLERAPDIFRRIDPDFDALSRIVIITRGGRAVELGRVAKMAASAMLSSLLAATGAARMKAEEIAWRAALVSDKVELLRDLKEFAQPIPKAIEEALERLGFVGIALIPLPKHPILVVYPEIPKVEELKRWAVLTWKGKTIIVPIIRIAEQDYLVVPNIDVQTEELDLSQIEKLLKLEAINLETEVAQLQKLKMKQIQLPKPEIVPAPAPTPTPVPRPGPIAVPPPAAPMMIPGIPLYLVTRSRRGEQLEVLVL